MSVRAINKRVRQVLGELLEGPEEFRRWLTNQSEEREFTNGSQCGCPLYGFISHHLAGRGLKTAGLEVTGDEVRWQARPSSTTCAEDLPGWAEDFSTLDCDISFQGIKRITKIKALDMLAEVLNEKQGQ